MKKIVSIILLVILLLSYCSISIGAITDNDNGLMKCYKNTYNFDIKGYVNGELQSTTFYDSGYYTKLKVDSNEVKDLYFSDYSEQIVDGVKWDIDCSFINNGRYVKIIYTLTNTENTNKIISLGSYADVQIAKNDRATIERFENSKGLKLYDNEKNIQFSFYGKSVAGTTDIDNLWMGEYPDQKDNCFNSNTTQKIEERDSAFAYSWIDRTLVAGETNTYSVIIGMGEVSNAPKIELEQDQGSCFSQDSVIINGTISDNDSNSKATLYYAVDEGVEKNLEEQTLTNNKVKFSLDLTSENLSFGNHKIKLWAIDESGNPSEILQKQILITNLKAPTLNMNEEWSKESVKFTITDAVNNPEDVLKYQYKIDDGEWIEVQLNTEITALENNGTATVKVRTVGNQEDEYSTIVTKTAKVDMNGPVITVKEENCKITISAVDEQIGEDTIKYIITSLEEFDEEQLLEYTKEIEYNTTEKGSLYLHIVATDKLGNKTIIKKEYKFPTAPTIDVQEEFIVSNPVYQIKDETNQGYIYQVKLNDEEWKNVNLNTEYIIENPKTGKNIIKSRTVDHFGRVSEESERTINYVKEDTTIKKDGNLPNAGISTIFGIVIFLISSAIISIHKYNKFKMVK